MSLVPYEVGAPIQDYQPRLRRGGWSLLATAIAAVFVSLSALAFALMLRQVTLPTSGVVVMRLDPQPTQAERAHPESVLLAAAPLKAPSTPSQRSAPPETEPNTDSVWSNVKLVVPMALPSPRAKPQAQEPQIALRSSLTPQSAPQMSEPPAVTQILSPRMETAVAPQEMPLGAQAPAIQDIPQSLPQAPLPGLYKSTIQGLLPEISPTGERSYIAYARPFDTRDSRPRIVLMIGGLGLSPDSTQTAIDQLPGAITLSFVPHGTGLQSAIDAARNAGHEVMLEVPMEAFGGPENQPSPYTLLSANTPPQNLSRLHYLMSRFSGYVGITNYLGAKFTADSSALQPVLQDIKARGLMVFDDGSSKRSAITQVARQVGLPVTKATRIIDQTKTAEAIDQALLALEQEAQRDGFVIATGYAYPLTVDRINAWAKTLEDKGIVLAPASSSLHSQKRKVAMIAPAR